MEGSLSGMATSKKVDLRCWSCGITCWMLKGYLVYCRRCGRRWSYHPKRSNQFAWLGGFQSVRICDNCGLYHDGVKCYECGCRNYSLATSIDPHYRFEIDGVHYGVVDDGQYGGRLYQWTGEWKWLRNLKVEHVALYQRDGASAHTILG